MLKKYCTLACALALVAGMAGSSFAHSIRGLILDGVVSRLSDNSLEALWNSGFAYPSVGAGFGDTTLDVGDRLLAIGRIDQIQSPFPSPDKNFPADWNEEFTFVSLIQVTSITPTGPGGTGPYNYTFGPSSTADPLGLGWQSGTMIATYSDPSNDYTASPASITDGVNRATNGTAWWEFGFSGAPGESWTATGVPTTDIASLPLGAAGTVNFQLDLLDLNAGIGLAPITLTLETIGNGNIIGLGGGSINGWQAVDDYNAFILHVPEPGSMAIFGLLGIAPLARRFRRK